MAALLTAAFGAFLICAAFGIMYNIRSPRLVCLAGIVGVLGGVGYQATINIGGEPPAASFVGAVAFSVAAWIASRLTDEPVIMFQAPALIPLVPGGDIYRMMSSLLSGDGAKAQVYGSTALSVAGMLLLGMLLVSSVPYSIRHLKAMRAAREGRRRS